MEEEIKITKKDILDWATRKSQQVVQAGLTTTSPENSQSVNDIIEWANKNKSQSQTKKQN